MKLIIIFTIIVLPFSALCQDKKESYFAENISIEFFVCGRFASPGGYDNGIYNHKMDKKSIYTQRRYTNYKTRGSYDSAYQYFYKKIAISRDSLKQIIDTSTFHTSNEPFYYPDRMIVLIHNENGLIDTIKLNDHRAINFNNAIYEYNKKLMTFILNNLPPELRDNWSLTTNEARIRIIEPNSNYNKK